MNWIAKSQQINIQYIHQSCFSWITSFIPFIPQKTENKYIFTTEGNIPHYLTRLSSPQINTSIIHLIYQPPILQLTDIINQDHFIAIIGNQLFSLPSNYQIQQIGPKHQLNSIPNLRKDSFDYILTSNNTIEFLQNIAKGIHPVTIRIDSDEELIELISNWESIHKKIIFQGTLSFQRFLWKMAVKINKELSHYYVTINCPLSDTFQEFIREFEIEPNIVNKLNTCLNGRQCSQIYTKWKKSEGFKKMDLLSLLFKYGIISKYQIYEFTYLQKAYWNEQKIKNIELRIKKDFSYDSTEIINSQSQNEEEFLLHELDRFQGIEQQEYRRLEKPHKVSKYLSRSFSGHQNEITVINQEYLSQYLKDA